MQEFRHQRLCHRDKNLNDVDAELLMIAKDGDDWLMTRENVMLNDDNQSDDEGKKIRIRRTNDYMAPWMTQLIAPRLPEELLQKIEDTAPHTPVSSHYHHSEKLNKYQVRGIHTNWRVAVYYPGNTFPS